MKFSPPPDVPIFDLYRQEEVALSLQDKERQRQTIAELRSRLKSSTRAPTLYIELATYYTRCQQLEAAIAVLHDGLALCEPDERLYDKAIFALGEANRTEEAISLARSATELFGRSRYFKLRESLMLPVLYETEEEIDRYRTRFAAGLKAAQAGLKLDTPEDCRGALGAVSQHVNFYLGYQGRDDRKLQEGYGQFVHRIMAANYPQWVKPLRMPSVPPGTRIRVGYISAHFRNHSVSKLFLGWLAEHNRQEFEVVGYHNGRTVDRVTDRVRELSDQFHHIPGEFEALCRAVLSDNLHIAVFLDVRHRRMALASSLRLAPVQCLAWAHPITSGSPMIDYYLSSDLMEPEAGQDHYSERLIRLPGIGVCYPKPVIPRALLGKSLRDFGVKEKRIVFLCCQSIFKYLPQHDDIFARIARRVPASQFVFLAFNDVVAADFRTRLQRAFKAQGLEAPDHCVILRQLNSFDYWNLNLISDVFLDSLEWSGGVTALEAIACGLPIVTLPGRFMRGRHTYGILTQLGVPETIARDKQEYVDIAVRLAEEREWRAQILERMKANQSRLYSDTRCVGALEGFYQSAVTERLNAQCRPVSPSKDAHNE